ncbi:hypothetical protein EDD80_104245 [Anseongella ginsenosidimutans]|uniref:Viral A-type inclusion protein n=1 Tax=Anseongella ginsenosidimutans TaxID=496056 RepID=A0A4R3KS66_9SPHI|nr:hypothetical protein [Anseongella ginsenosidimutans]QEC53257.1 hypothetical protein FRZ59_13515 [Anseongella ginsenosidimutans]TCS87894.1 hypothetical protein EDD80_104245 [Anseongella ginsenosidimutans]
MKILYKALLLAAVAFLAGCQPGTNEADALKSEVIKVHDRIMPRNSELLAAKRDLIKVISSLDSLKQAKPETDTASIHQQADSLLQSLDAADKAMSDWMYAFKTDYSEMGQQQVMDYLEAEKTRITGIEEAYEASIGGARSLLDSIDKK